MPDDSRTFRIAFAGGGTGGHIYPALAVGQTIRSRPNIDAEMLFVGSTRNNEREIVERTGIPFHGVASGALRGRNPLLMALNLLRLARGTWEARQTLRTFGAQAVFATGGYASVPVGVAARSLGIPVIIYLPDIHPGWAVRLLARLARTVAATADESLKRLPKGKSVVTGYPVRADFNDISRDEARAKLGLTAERPTVLVFGGSLGARRINRALYPDLARILEIADVIHVSGIADFQEAQQVSQRLPDELRARYHCSAYLHELPEAMMAVDLAVTRAGASTLGELPAARLPAIVVPLDLSDQSLNARFLEQSGATRTLTHADLGRLADEIVSLLNDGKRLANMREAMATIARPDAADRLADLLIESVTGA